MEERKIYCPVNGWDCPYWQEDGSCTLEDPLHECDDFRFLWDEGDEYWSDEEIN